MAFFMPYLLYQYVSLARPPFPNHKSDISQVFEVDDILVLSKAITALSGGDLKKKMDILSSAPSSVFFEIFNFGVGDLGMITFRILKNTVIQQL